jgi:hypothetical protein
VRRNIETLFISASVMAESDIELSGLLQTAREYADIYLLAGKMQKGCDGMGELAMVKEEFRDSLDDLINYCKGKGYIYNDIRYEVDSI